MSKTSTAHASAAQASVRSLSPSFAAATPAAQLTAAFYILIFSAVFCMATTLIAEEPSQSESLTGESTAEAQAGPATPSPSAFDYGAMEKRAEAYFKAYESLDVAAMAANYHDHVEFIDETAEAIGTAYRMSGKEEIRAAFEGFLPHIRKLKVEFSERYFSGKIGVFRGIYHARVQGIAIGADAEELYDVEYPFITVLEFEDGLVRKHIDYIDYLSMASRLQDLEPISAGAS